MRSVYVSLVTGCGQCPVVEESQLRKYKAKRRCSWQRGGAGAGGGREEGEGGAKLSDQRERIFNIIQGLFPNIKLDGL